MKMYNRRVFADTLGRALTDEEFQHGRITAEPSNWNIEKCDHCKDTWVMGYILYRHEWLDWPRNRGVKIGKICHRCAVRVVDSFHYKYDFDEEMIYG
jgi:hypothetical protein